MTAVRTLAVAVATAAVVAALASGAAGAADVPPAPFGALTADPTPRLVPAGATVIPEAPDDPAAPDGLAPGAGPSTLAAPDLPFAPAGPAAAPTAPAVAADVPRTHRLDFVTAAGVREQLRANGDPVATADGRPLDLALDGAVDGWRPRAAAVPTLLPPSLGRIAFPTGHGPLVLEPRDLGAVAGRQAGEAVLYSAVAPGVDALLRALPAGPDLHLFVAGPGAAHAFTFTVTAPPGATVDAPVDDGPVTVRGPDGRVDGELTPVRVTDAAGTTAAGRYALVGDQLTITVPTTTPDGAPWRYPLDVDPTYRRAFNDLVSLDADACPVPQIVRATEPVGRDGDWAGAVCGRRTTRASVTYGQDEFAAVDFRPLDDPALAGRPLADAEQQISQVGWTLATAFANARFVHGRILVREPRGTGFSPVADSQDTFEPGGRERLGTQLPDNTTSLSGDYPSDQYPTRGPAPRSLSTSKTTFEVYEYDETVGADHRDTFTETTTGANALSVGQFRYEVTDSAAPQVFDLAGVPPGFVNGDPVTFGARVRWRHGLVYGTYRACLAVDGQDRTPDRPCTPTTGLTADDVVDVTAALPEGRHQVAVTAYDPLGNGGLTRQNPDGTPVPTDPPNGHTASAEVRVDRTPPVLDVRRIDGRTGTAWSTVPVRLRLAAVDPARPDGPTAVASGWDDEADRDARTQATVDGDPVAVRAQSVVAIGDGRHTVAITIADRVDNRSAPVRVPVWIDGTAPAVALTEGSGTITATTTDTLSGPATTITRLVDQTGRTIRTGNGTTRATVSTADLPPGRYRIVADATDTATNTSRARAEIVKTDERVPATLRAPRAPATPPINAQVPVPTYDEGADTADRNPCEATWRMPAHALLDKAGNLIPKGKRHVVIPEENHDPNFVAPPLWNVEIKTPGCARPYQIFIDGVKRYEGSDAPVTFPLRLNQRYTVEVRQPQGTRTVFTFRPKNILLVGLGDSYASGEGNPDITKIRVNDEDLRPSGWMNKTCHRSASSPLAKLAGELERVDPKTSVTLVDVSCSGATTDNLTSTPYRGAEPDQITFDKPALVPQLQDVKRLLRNRTPDVVTVSAGGNDVEFGNIIDLCYSGSCDVQQNRPCYTDDCGPAAYRPLGNFPRLEANYPLLGDCLAARGQCPDGSRIGSFANPDVPGRIHFVAYPNPTRGRNGKTCGEDGSGNSHILADLPGDPSRKNISAKEAQAAESEVLVRLRDQIRSFTVGERFSFVEAHYLRSFTHGYCAEDRRWFRTYKDAGKRQEEVLKVRDFRGAIKQYVAPGTLHPNGPGTTAIQQAIQGVIRSDTIGRFPTLQRVYP